MQKLKLILILCSLSFTVSSQQSDTTLCFTKAQVRQFLFTKAELNLCNENEKILSKKITDLKEENEDLTDQATKTKKKLKRTRIIAGGSGGVAILSGLLLFLKN